MKTPFQPGDTLEYTRIVLPADIAAFDSGTVHEVYSTFSLARDAEWSGRLFVLEMKEAHEEGIGTRISVEHRGPAFVGEEIRFVAEYVGISEQREIVTRYKAWCGERLIAEGEQGQKILPKDKIEARFAQLRG